MGRRPRGLRGVLVGAIVLPLLAVLSACAPRPPEILRIESELRLVTDRVMDREYEQLSLFLEAEDPDGFEDLDEVLLLHDQSGLYWRIDRNSWAVTRGEGWFGSAGLTMPLFTPFPRGVYRLRLYDAGGHSEEVSVSIDAALEAVGEPDVLLDDAGIDLLSPERVVLQAVDPQGRTVAQKRLYRGRHDWDAIFDGAEIPLDTRVFLYLPSSEERLPRIVGPFFR
jgi:hypothetical protein